MNTVALGLCLLVLVYCLRVLSRARRLSEQSGKDALAKVQQTTEWQAVVSDNADLREELRAVKEDRERAHANFTLSRKETGVALEQLDAFKNRGYRSQPGPYRERF